MKFEIRMGVPEMEAFWDNLSAKADAGTFVNGTDKSVCATIR
jgi:hypothetical protein